MRSDDGTDDLPHHFGVRALFQNEIAELVALFGTVCIHNVDGAAFVGEFLRNFVGKRADRLLSARDLGEHAEPAVRPHREHGLEPQNGACDRCKPRASAAALQVHEVVYDKIDADAVGKCGKEIEDLPIGRALLFEQRCLFRLNARAQRDAVGIKHRAFTVGIDLFQLAQGKLKRCLLYTSDAADEL